MDVSAFMTGYFLGLIAGAGVFVLWTYKFGRFLPKEWPFKWRLFSDWTDQEDEGHFATRRANREQDHAT